MDQIINDSKSHIWKSFFQNIISYIQLFYICSNALVDIRVFFNIRFSSKKSQSQQKVAKKITHFTIQFCSKNLTHLMNLNSLDVENNMLLQHSQKPFQQTYFCSMSEKTFALYHFLTPKNCILQALWNQMSVYFCISP